MPPRSSGSPAPSATQRRPPGRIAALGSSTPLLLVRAAHPRQAVLTALGMGMAAALAGRPVRELGLVVATVLVGQVILGWANDLVDRARDQRHDLPGKPLARGLLEPGTVWFSLTCALLLVVPLSIAAGPIAGGSYLASLLVGLLGQRLLRRGVLSFVPWTVSFALYPAYLSYGGWGGEGTTTPPTIAMTVLAGLLGVCVHVLCALPGLVQDNRDGYRTLPLRIALRTGAPRLLVVAGVATALVVAGLLATGLYVGLGTAPA